MKKQTNAETPFDELNNEMREEFIDNLVKLGTKNNCYSYVELSVFTK